MSLQTDGVWKAAVWAATVWADGVWFEGVRPDPPSPPAPVAEQPRGTVGWLYGKYAPGDRRRTSSDILRDRERYGIPPAASAVISAVAHRQAETLQTDAQKKYEELARELELRGIEWRGEYLEELNARLERLISAEIAARLKLMQAARDDEDALVMLLAMVV